MQDYFLKRLAPERELDVRIGWLPNILTIETINDRKVLTFKIEYAIITLQTSNDRKENL